jgi:hypothetical protein
LGIVDRGFGSSSFADIEADFLLVDIGLGFLPVDSYRIIWMMMVSIERRVDQITFDFVDAEVRSILLAVL